MTTRNKGQQTATANGRTTPAKDNRELAQLLVISFDSDSMVEKPGKSVVCPDARTSPGVADVLKAVVEVYPRSRQISCEVVGGDPAAKEDSTVLLSSADSATIDVIFLMS